FFIKNYKGETVTVSDEEILSASKKLAEDTGVFSEPAAAAAFTGFLKFHRHDKIAKGSTNVVLLTGSGLKDIQAVQPLIHLPKPVAPDFAGLKQFLKM
ncbi:MAG: pyridoxal-phosphate dependent enzyme, partial [Bacteroidetes bacterium]|nr:pyridoxal-phosphate dependent enzyme [Bacteroidota bacterium]